MSNFPEWAVPGAKVLIVSTRYGERSYGGGVISRLTKTRIVVAQNLSHHERQFVQSRFDEDRWEQYGATNNWYSAPKLIGGDSDEAKALYAETAKRRIEGDAINACNNFAHDRTVESAQAAIDALTTYLADQ